MTTNDGTVDEVPLWEDHGPGEVLAYRIAHLPPITGLGRTSLYEAIRRGDLRARKYGSATLVLRADLVAFLESLPARSGEVRP